MYSSAGSCYCKGVWFYDHASYYRVQGIQLTVEVQFQACGVHVLGWYSGACFLVVPWISLLSGMQICELQCLMWLAGYMPAPPLHGLRAGQISPWSFSGWRPWQVPLPDNPYHTTRQSFDMSPWGPCMTYLLCSWRLSMLCWNSSELLWFVVFQGMSGLVHTVTVSCYKTPGGTQQCSCLSLLQGWI